MKQNIDKIKDYFTKEIRDKINEMTNTEMVNLLKELEGTPFWFAILRYNQNRIGVVQSSFLVLDPNKEASKISQYQGIITGVLDLQDAVLSLKFEAKKQEDPNYKKEKKKEENFGAYTTV